MHSLGELRRYHEKYSTRRVPASATFALIAVEGGDKAMRVIKAAISYFAIVFAVGFLLGTLRVLFVAPSLGERLAVLIESPLMIGVSWVACRWSIHKFSVQAALVSRATMGVFAFALLMAGELGVSILAFKRTVDDYFQNYRTEPAIIGLAAQIAFALFPIIQLYLRPGTP